MLIMTEMDDLLFEVWALAEEKRRDENARPFSSDSFILF